MKKSLSLSLITIFLCQNAMANQTVNPNTHLTVYYPKQYDSSICDATTFDDRVNALAIPNIPLTNATSLIKTDSSTHRNTLTVSLTQKDIATDVIQIEGGNEVLQAIASDLNNGKPVSLTEFKACADQNPNLRLVGLATTNLTPQSLEPDLQAGLEYIKPINKKKCGPVFSMSLAKTIKAFNYQIDLTNIATKVTIRAKSFKTDGTIIGKEIELSFYEIDNPSHVLKQPVFLFHVPANLTYAAINKFHSPTGVLRMTKDVACQGPRADDPLWIYNL